MFVELVLRASERKPNHTRMPIFPSGIEICLLENEAAALQFLKTPSSTSESVWCIRSIDAWVTCEVVITLVGGISIQVPITIGGRQIAL